jgi:hypothetical protein
MLASGSIFAEENRAFSSRTSTTPKVGFTLGYNSDQMAEYAIDERILDRLGLLDPSDSGQSSRYSVELELENEDSDWSFEVTVTVEF